LGIFLVSASILLLAGYRESMGIIFLAFLQSYAVFAVNFYSAVLAMEYRFKLRSLLLFLPNTLHTLLSALVILSIPTISPAMGKIWGNATGILLFAVFSYAAVALRGRAFIRPDYWKYGVSISLPSIAYSLSDLILMQCDRIMITAVYGAAETGIYSNAYNIGSILWVLSTATGSAWMPMFYRLLSGGKIKDIRTYASFYIAAFTVAGIGLLMISPELIKLLTPAEYWGGIYYLPPIIFASYTMFLYSFPVNTEFYYKKTKTIARNTIIVSALNVVLNAVFIRLSGPTAAAFTTVFCYSALFFLHWFAAEKLYPGLFPKTLFAIAASSFAAFALIFYAALESWIIRYGICTAILIISAIAFIFYKDKFKGVLLQHK
jgi:O-antigen/teichoic acid export membrane protein